MDQVVDVERAAELRRREDERFTAEHPRSIELLARARESMPRGVPMPWMGYLYDHPAIFVDTGDGSHFTDVDGHRYLDLSLGITVASTGHTQPAVIAAVEDRMRRGIQFVLPTEDAIAVSEELARRWGLPKWQHALVATQSVIDVIRLARHATGRDRILVFEGKYHGMISETLAIIDEGGRTTPEFLGLSDRDIARTTVVHWNDLGPVERALASGDVALVLAEPALTNSGVVFPAPGFHEGLRRITLETGTLLAIDETQTLPMAFGGLVREWALASDFVILGKSLGGGVPVSAYGMTEEIARLIDRDAEPWETLGESVDEPALGGTTFGNALSMAAARAALFEVWTEENHAHTRNLAERLSIGMEKAIRGHGRDWHVYGLGNRAGFRFAADPPVDNVQAGEQDVPLVRNLQRVYMANRGVWEFGWWCGPAISIQTKEDDVDLYVGLFDGFLDELLG